MSILSNIIGISALTIFCLTSGICGLIMLLVFCAVAYNIGKDYGL